MKRIFAISSFVLLVLMFGSAQQVGDENRDPNEQMQGGPKHSEPSKRPDKGHNKEDRENKQSGAKADIDKNFLREAAEGGVAEVQLGQLAVEKASDPQVKQFGQRMQDDHGRANEELKSLARPKGVQMPTSLSSKHQALKDKLSGLSGRQFDQQYMQAMVADHQHDVSEFQKAADGAQDEEVKKFAAKTMAVLQEHLKQSQQILGKLRSTSKQRGATSQ